jgi:hypothetical protein
MCPRNLFGASVGDARELVAQEALTRMPLRMLSRADGKLAMQSCSVLMLGEFVQDGSGGRRRFGVSHAGRRSPFREHSSVRHGRRFVGTFHEARRGIDMIRYDKDDHWI